MYSQVAPRVIGTQFSATLRDDAGRLAGHTPQGRMFREFLAAHLGLLYELSGVVVLLVAVIGVAGALVSRFDRIPLEDAIYFAFITAFTVGFGDVAPRSRGARVVTVFLALFGLILVGVAVAVAVHALDIVLTARGA